MSSVRSCRPPGTCRCGCCRCPGWPAGRWAAAAACHLVERHARVYRHAWLILISGFFEPLFYLLSIGVGLGELVGTVAGPATARSPTPASWRPALLATSSMNGAVFDSTFNVFFRLKYDKLYDAVLATPMRAGDIALGEISWALIRGGLYAVGVHDRHAGPAACCTRGGRCWRCRRRCSSGSRSPPPGWRRPRSCAAGSTSSS